MNETLKEILIAWQKANDQVEDNSSLLLQNNELFADLCTARMNVCYITDGMLYSLPIEDADYPEELERHLKANADKGCAICRYSSFTGETHPDCEMKINEWFESKEHLLMFIELIL